MDKEKKNYSRPFITLATTARTTSRRTFAYLMRKKKPMIPVHASRLARAFFSARNMCLPIIFELSTANSLIVLTQFNIIRQAVKKIRCRVSWKVPFSIGTTSLLILLECSCVVFVTFQIVKYDDHERSYGDFKVSLSKWKFLLSICMGSQNELKCAPHLQHD